MKVWTLAIFALCAFAGAASATTLPPYHEKATRIAMMPAPPAPAATPSERDYFSAPEAKDAAAQRVSCRTIAVTAASRAWANGALCD